MKIEDYPQLFKKKTSVTFSKQAAELILVRLEQVGSVGKIQSILGFYRQVVQGPDGTILKETGPGIAWAEYSDTEVPTDCRIPLGSDCFAVISSIGEETKPVFLDVNENGIYVSLDGKGAN